MVRNKKMVASRHEFFIFNFLRPIYLINSFTHQLIDSVANNFPFAVVKLATIGYATNLSSNKALPLSVRQRT
jgi:hypothetical protein